MFENNLWIKQLKSGKLSQSCLALFTRDEDPDPIGSGDFGPPDPDPVGTFFNGSGSYL